ncbi:nucleoside triphosphate pyrophosphohydrolase [Spirulina major CS-329]|jgi:predicted house-cleaning noncanonical NTP pyrophosphatase (MazG superfamily)|uniref:nucleoside triphosphate pyrophosphohydrolase n=1 Tax=Spirulina TaxID=1154 RepID=UPI00232B6912|nr:MULTISPECIES: nucleoside triphosphate pyrophosphohydrolase [Spirulina]MDB9493477.1 nucleoside triphosphate pyrophosphohydrolase [Spirulina subsalsa CS-330]MDB9503231.1 nucleoside triphosphate pyrophosphohydrolase [Spirulina major CS-329]
MTDSTLPKLIRDRIPEIITAAGRTSITRVLSAADYDQALRAKLQEEAAEAAAASPADLLTELADLQEVIEHLLAFYDLDPQALAQIKAQRQRDRGGFQQRLELIAVDSQDSGKL